MASTISSSFPAVKFDGADCTNSLAYRFNDADRVVLCKQLVEQPRFAVACWHGVAKSGSDQFSGPTISRLSMRAGEPIARAKLKADAAFGVFGVLGLPLLTLRQAQKALEVSLV